MLIKDFLPPADIAVELEPEELAIPLLNYLIKEEQGGPSGNLNLHNFIISLSSEEYVIKESRQSIERKLTESWMWLEREGMLAPSPGKDRRWVYVTDRGKELAGESDINKYKRSNIIPKQALDPVLANKVLPLFIRGDYDTAVFQAFKEVEIRVRKATSLPQEMVGVELMRTAFHPKTGKLTDNNLPEAEREAMSHLFAGSIGLFKNPSSHRDVDWENPNECAELIYLANHLLGIVNKHTKS